MIPTILWAKMTGASPCLQRNVEPSDMIIAHRTLPCGTRVLVTLARTGKSIVATVGDRGPYGAVCGEKKRWCLKRSELDPGVWRGQADLTPAVAAAIGHRGFETVLLTVLPSAPRQRSAHATRPVS